MLLPQVFRLDQVDRQALAGRQVPVQHQVHQGLQRQAVQVGHRAAAVAQVQAGHQLQAAHQVQAQQRGQVEPAQLVAHRAHQQQTVLADQRGHLDLAAARAARVRRVHQDRQGQVRQMVQGVRQVLRAPVQLVGLQDQARLVGRLVLRAQARQRVPVVHLAFKEIDMQQHQHQVLL